MLFSLYCFDLIAWHSWSDVLMSSVTEKHLPSNGKCGLLLPQKGTTFFPVKQFSRS